MIPLQRLYVLFFVVMFVFAAGCGDSGDSEKSRTGSREGQSDIVENIPYNAELLLEEPPNINPADYLAMSDEEIGQLRWALKIADQPLDDFSLIPSLNILGVPVTGVMNLAFSSLRYNIAFYTYYLATIQYHKIPACHDIIQPRMDRMIAKMQEGAVWKYWALTSTGYFTFFAAPMTFEQPGLYQSERDPVRIKNIMYSGHLAQMISLYEKLYGDMKWDEEGAIKFIWSEDEQYTYNTSSLHKLLRDAFIDLPSHCIECEPNLCFAECNQHPMLALKVYDQVHGKTYFEDVQQLQIDWNDKNDMIDPDTHNTSAVHFSLTGKTLGPDWDDWDTGNILSRVTVPVTKMLKFKLAFAIADGWTMSFMHGWRKNYVQRHYWGVGSDGGNRANRIDLETGRLKADVVWDDRLDLVIIYDSLGVPFYGMLAAEMGDKKVQNGIVQQCDDFFKPEWTEDGEFHYPVGNADTIVNFSGERTRHVAISGTGALAGIARSNPKDGLYKLHSDPVPGAGGPMVENINIYKTNLRRAIYDKNVNALIVSTDTGPDADETDVEAFNIVNLDVSKTYTLKIDGIIQETWSGRDEISVEIPLDGPHDIILVSTD